MTYVLIVMALTGQIATHKFPTDQICESVKADLIKHQYKAICVPVEQ